MIASAQEAPERGGVWQFLRDELSLSPERGSRMLRMTALVALVTVLSMALRVPDAAVSAFLIFFATGTDFGTTARTGVGGALGATVAVLLVLVLYSFALAEPALRVPLMACVIFAGMYFTRVSKLGPVGWVVAFIVSYSLTFADQGIGPERLTRSVLWAWSFVAYPLALLVVVDFVLGRRAADVFRDAVAERLEAAADLLAAPSDGPARARALRLGRAGTARLAPYVKAGPPGGAAARASILRQLDLLFLLLHELPDEAATLPETHALLAGAAEVCRSARKALAGGESFAAREPGEAACATCSAATLAVILPLIDCVDAIGRSIVEARNPTASTGAVPAPAAPVQPDRTEAVRFAAKVTLAAMVAYILYTSLAWSGIHTAMLTCMIVAQGTLGATIHKLSLRIAGAVLGGTIGILSIVFILPQLESIGGLVVLVAIVTLFAAWIATGSAAISYAGIQIGFAFYLTVLQGYSRTSKMVVGRDRVLGILLGNLIISVVFTTLWPVRIKPTIRKALSRAVEALAGALRAGSDGAREAEIAFHANLRTALDLAAVRRLEPGEDDRWSAIPAIESFFVRIHAILRRPEGVTEPARQALVALREAAAAWLGEFAAAIAAPHAIPPFRPAAAAAGELGRLAGSPDADSGLRARAALFADLDARIEQFVAREKGSA